jgi:hypothetical protein
MKNLWVTLYCLFVGLAVATEALVVQPGVAPLGVEDTAVFTPESGFPVRDLGNNGTSQQTHRRRLDMNSFGRFIIDNENTDTLSPAVIAQLEKEQDVNLRKHRRLQEKKKKTQQAQVDKRAIPTTDAAMYFSRSPFNGTDIVSHPIALIRCSNQTLCIQPQLQLQKVYKVYYCKHVSHGVRFYFLIREALLLHPNIILVDDPEVADVIVYLPESAVWHKTECAVPKYKSKTIVLDETDGPNLFEPDNTDEKTPWLLYFKRSCRFSSKGRCSSVCFDFHICRCEKK